MDLEQAIDNFTRATRHCDNLIEIHRNHGGPKQGRRDKETTLNRAAVVLTVAAWQAAVQDFARAAVEATRPGGNSPQFSLHTLIEQRMERDITNFATPNAEKTRELLKIVGFDPRRHWQWTQPGRDGTMTPHRAEQTINAWLRVRHAIAHGHAKLPEVEVLQAVRQNQMSRGPALRLYDAELCLRFFRRLVYLTSDGLASHLQVDPPEYPQVD